MPRFVRKGLTEYEKRIHARQLNLARRHLDRSQKRALIAEQLKETPEKSNRQVAVGLGVDHKTVAAVKSELEQTGEIPQLNKTVGADGTFRNSVGKFPTSRCLDMRRNSERFFSVTPTSFSWVRGCRSVRLPCSVAPNACPTAASRTRAARFAASLAADMATVCPPQARLRPIGAIGANGRQGAVGRSQGLAGALLGMSVEPIRPGNIAPGPFCRQLMPRLYRAACRARQSR